MKPTQAIQTDSWADGAYLEAGCLAPPIDLNAIARTRKVSQIKLRLMVQEGALVPVPRGFEVYIQSLKRRDLDVEAPESPDALSFRQRFTLAHEIAHTRFYKTHGEIPIPTGEAKENYRDPKNISLEKICDRAAARLLVPKQLLKNEIRGSLNGDCERIDAPFVHSMVSRFRVSHEVVIGRLRAVEPSNAFARCISLIRKIDGVHQLVDWYIGGSLLSVLPRLSEYQYKPILALLPNLPTAILEGTESAECRRSVPGRDLLIRKFPLGNARDFLLQVDDAAHMAPNSYPVRIRATSEAP